MGKMKIAWREQFNSGYPQIDKQHKELVSIINEFLERLSAECPLADIHYYMAEIYRLIEAHFLEENNVMQDAAYPHRVAHIGDHGRLLDTIRDINAGITTHGEQISKEELAETVEAWFSVHFLSHDARFHEFARNRSTQSDNA